MISDDMTLYKISYCIVFHHKSSCIIHRYYDAVPQIVQDMMDQVAVITGRQYKLFEFYGDPEAERVVVLMGSAAKTAEETVDYLRKQGEKARKG